MSREDLRRRITDQFSYGDRRADVWRAFDWVLATDRYLNLGYSPRYWPTLVGSSQRRLVDLVGDRLAARLPETRGARLIDVGCGRGGPAVRLADRHGFAVTGVDLVPYNVARAGEHARASSATAAFVVGDAGRLPVRDGAVGAATAVDALVYLPETTAVFGELARVVQAGGALVVSDLLLRSSPTADERAAADAFADAWDMPPLETVPAYERHLRAAGFREVGLEDVTAHSVGRFRRWTTLYRSLTATPAGRVLAAVLRRRGLDPEAIDEQVRLAHAALPSLRHVIVDAAAP